MSSDTWCRDVLSPSPSFPSSDHAPLVDITPSSLTHTHTRAIHPGADSYIYIQHTLFLYLRIMLTAAHTGIYTRQCTVLQYGLVLSYKCPCCCHIHCRSASAHVTEVCGLQREPQKYCRFLEILIKPFTPGGLGRVVFPYPGLFSPNKNLYCWR